MKLLERSDGDDYFSCPIEGGGSEGGRGGYQRKRSKKESIYHFAILMVCASYLLVLFVCLTRIFSTRLAMF